MAYSLAVLVLLGLVGRGLCYTADQLGPDIEGPYCGINRECCTGRIDRCAHKILDTLCYCDEFCDRNNHDDCCPDYYEVCRGIKPVKNETDNIEPPENVIEPCKHAGHRYIPGESRETGCNTCKCVLTPTNQTVWDCTNDPCLISEDVISGVNNDISLGWHAHNYTQFAGKKLADGLVYKLGTLPLSAQTKKLGPINYDKDIDYPKQFDAREHWPNFISPVMDQGWCGSDWAVSLAAIASDRFAIQSNGAEKVQLSPQVLLSCNFKGQKGCKGGNIDNAWIFAKNFGLVDESCYPYEAKRTKCPYKKGGNLLDDGCTPVVPLRTSRYKVGPPARLIKEKNVMWDIMQSGPIQAVMTVYQDFFHYRNGIYRRSSYGNDQMKGHHSVRIVGWGEENDEKYWIVANSWGPEWGENGYFRIVRGNDESGIESFMVSAFSAVTEAYLRK